MAKARKKLKILFVTSELAPYAKTGGLADVTSSLATELVKRGHDVRVVLPFYRCVRKFANSCKTVLSSMCVKMGGDAEEWTSVFEIEHDGGVPVYLLEHNNYFDRDGLYNDNQMNDYSDNPYRFAFLSRGALQICLDINFKPDIIHSHDWQASLTPAYQKTWFWNSEILGNSASVLTIHNIAYQGVYPGYTYSYTGLNQSDFVPDKFEAYGSVNYLKGGIYFADVVNTVSPGHAKEITTPHGGFGLAPYLSNKKDKFIGVLNGVDYSQWSPENCKMIPANYSVSDLSGKAVCKRELQKTMGIADDDKTCIIGTIGRFTEQKGYSMVRAIMENVLRDMKIQFVVLGSGDNDLEYYFGELKNKFPDRVGVYIGYNAELAYLIEAGSDFFLMPSMFEPCGLNQLYSMKFGTPPIVRATGGLDDTVEQYDEATGKGTGFKFYDPTPLALYNTIGWAVSTWYDRPKHIKKIIKSAMRKNYSWEKSLLEYEKLYKLAMKTKADYDKMSALEL